MYYGDLHVVFMVSWGRSNSISARGCEIRFQKSLQNLQFIWTKYSQHKKKWKAFKKNLHMTAAKVHLRFVYFLHLWIIYESFYSANDSEWAAVLQIWASQLVLLQNKFFFGQVTQHSNIIIYIYLKINSYFFTMCSFVHDFWR